MKKAFLTLIAVATLSLSAFGQTNAPADPVISPFTVADNTNAPSVTNILGSQVGSVLQFLSDAGTNLSVIPYGIYSEDTKSAGFGIAGVYSINDFAGAVMRFDYLDGEIWLPSGTFQLQLPLTIGKFQVVPFGLSGIATPLSGRGSENGEVVTILGAGLGVRVSNKLGIVYDAEIWSHFEGTQHRLGVMWRF